MTGVARPWLEMGSGLVALGMAVGSLAASARHAVPPASPGSPAPPTSTAPMRAAADPVASYTLTARLDAEQHVIHGQGQIRWRNAARVPVSELYLHLYLNAYENEETLFYRSPFGAARSNARPEHWGKLEVKRLVAEELGGVDLWRSAERHSPGDPHDRTDLRVPLPVPIDPQQELTLSLVFDAHLPSLVERTGYRGSFHFAGQWFPKLARLESDGHWRHFPFHPQAEFYADFGRYDVTIDVPESVLVGATGVRTQERRQNGRRVVLHEADSVHDFAFAAWDGFRERDETVEGTRVVVLYDPEHEHNATVALATIRRALPLLGARYGRYPYPTLTVVDPPRVAALAGGMEYPTLITTGGSWSAGYLTREVQAVTAHELAHQWFYGLVATDEAAWPFLDEGLATYAEGATLRDLFGPGSALDLPGLTLSVEELGRVVAQAAGGEDVVAQAAARFPSFSAVGENAYARTAAALLTLERVYGRAALDRALGRYAREQRFLHPGPETLLGTIGRELGPGAESTLRSALFERATVDYRVRALTSLDQSKPRAATSATRAPAEVTPERASHIGRVLAIREGDLKLPVEIELVDGLGRHTRQIWDGQSNWIWVSHAGPEPLRAAVIDPGRKIALDQDFTNNAVATDPDPPLRVLERLVYTAGLLIGGPVP